MSILWVAYIRNPLIHFCCLYKLLAKVLVFRLRSVMNPLITINQSAFLPNINILDGVVVINEVVDYTKKERNEGLILKVRKPTIQSIGVSWIT